MNFDTAGSRLHSSIKDVVKAVKTKVFNLILTTVLNSSFDNCRLGRVFIVGKSHKREGVRSGE